MDLRVQGDENEQVNPKDGSMLLSHGHTEDCILEMREGC